MGCLFGMAPGLRDTCGHQNGEVLDAELPEELCRGAVTLSKKNYYVHANHLCLCRSEAPRGASLMSALEAFEKFGGAALEEVLEFGSYHLKTGNSQKPQGDPG